MPESFRKMSFDNMLKSLPADTFLHWIEEEVAKRLLNHLKQASRVQKVLENLLSSMSKTNQNQLESDDSENTLTKSYVDTETIIHLCSNIKESYCNQVLTDNKNTMFRFCENSQKEISRILQIRVDQHSKLQLNDFVTTHRFVNKFIEETEKFCHRQCLSLRGTLASQVSYFGLYFLTFFLHIHFRPKNMPTLFIIPKCQRLLLF